MSENQVVGTRIQKLRERLGCSQDRMGQIIGVSGRTVSRWESQNKKISNLAQYRVSEIQAILRKMESAVPSGKVKDWLNLPQEALNDKTPLETITRGPEGMIELANFLGRLA